jgi:hypothetical protein
MRRGGRFWSLGLVALALLAAGPQVQAQAAGEPGAPVVLAQNESPGVFRFLFGRRGREVPLPPDYYDVQPERPRNLRPQPRRQPQPRTQRNRPPAAPAAREPAAVEKAPDAKRLLVVGDFWAAALAKGLTEAYAQNPNVLVIDQSKGSSGLVRDDVVNWPVRVTELVASERPDAILALVGANDRQAMRTESGSQALGSDGWRAGYAARVAALAEAIKAAGKPGLWVGLVPVRASSMSRDYSTFNGIAREQVESKGLVYVETWNGFADEEGKFVSSGPDVNGQTVQLRASDGLNFSRAGQRKLAFFVEQALNGILGGTVAALPGATGLGATSLGAGTLGPAAPPLMGPPLMGPPLSAMPAAPPPPRIGPMMALDSVTTGGATSLSVRATPAAAPAPAAAPGQADAVILRRLAGDKGAQPPSGRADDFAWPPPQP